MIGWEFLIWVGVLSSCAMLRGERIRTGRYTLMGIFHSCLGPRENREGTLKVSPKGERGAVHLEGRLVGEREQ